MKIIGLKRKLSYKFIYDFMILRFLLVFFIISACALSPGFKEEPSSKNPKRIGLKQNGVTLFFHNINKMNLSALPRIEDLKK